MKHSTRLKFEDIGKTILYGIGVAVSALKQCEAYRLEWIMR